MKIFLVRLLLAGMGLLTGACGMDEKIDVMLECLSPSGQKVATLYRVSTGDRPGDQYMKINIRPASDALDDGMHSFSFRHGYDAIIHWDSDHAMRIEYPEHSEITAQEQVVFGTSQTFSASDPLKLTYQERPSTHGHFMVEQRCFNNR
ncbi:MAG: hypothetical protein ACE5DZ_02700 [Mariprofundus sp.]